VLVVGGTGSLGQRLVRRLLECGTKSIKVYSRDEAKQAQMRFECADHRGLTFVLGDIRDAVRTREVMDGVTHVVNAAALKHVPLCEEAPAEAVYTNVVGAINLRRAAIDARVRRVVSISTDKAVAPVNVMGMTKALHERILLSQDDYVADTSFACVRYGNVLGSRGSVVPRFVAYVNEGRPLPITHHDMTRFVLTFSEAINFLLFALEQAKHGDLLVSKLPAVKLLTLARAIGREVANDPDYPIELVGVRAGEKLHEVLVSSDEMARAMKSDAYFQLARTTEPGDNSRLWRSYTSDMDESFLTIDEIAARLADTGLQASYVAAV
jgi:UDP-N-acetylglucosamine 4,6-dehydratase